MPRNRLFWSVIALLLVVALVTTACPRQTTPTPAPEATQPPAPTPTEAAAVQPTKPPAPTPTEAPPEPTATPTVSPEERTGAWVDQVVFSQLESGEQAIPRLEAGDIDIYGSGLSDPEVFAQVKDNPDLTYVESFGIYTELTFNPVLNFNDGRLNPFGDPQIREAINWAVDRDYIVQEIYGGLATAKYLPITSAFPDYARYVDKVRALEAKYAYDLEKARQVITERMEALGAEMVDGKWTYNGEPITIIFLIRTEDERTQIGDYVANQLEELGFTVDRQYKNRTEASPIWYSSEPAEGQWHVYTGGWITTAVDRDQGGNFAFFYTNLGLPGPLWQAYENVPEFYDIAKRLANNEFTSMEERDELFRQAMDYALQDSVRVWLADTVSFTPFSAKLEVAYDLAGGVQGSALWPFTLRWKDQVGGTVRWGQPGVLIEPWNPLGGSNWIYDTDVQRATGEFAVVTNPYTGLGLPNRVERAEVVAETGLPIRRTLDWVTLEFQDEITVPEDAWADWDAAEQRFITVGEKFPDGATAKVKTVVYYEEDMFDKVKWHDGSPLTVADFVMNMILTFDRGKEESQIYDEAVVPSLESFLSVFKGVRIVSTDPLVIETYSDSYSLDAENTVSTWWPYYDFGQSPWHSLAVGWLAETNGELAFTSDKSEAAGVEWMNFISGPSLEILKKYLDQAAEEGFIPYEPTLGEYVTADEAKARYENLAKWYDEMGHFWVGTGPFYLSRVDTTAQVVVIDRNPDYPDPATKWAGFGTPKIADVEVDGPGQVTAGQEATFDVYVTYQDEPYPADDIEAVKYLVFDDAGNLVTSGDAELVEDGTYQVVLSGDVTQNIPAGPAKIEVAVTSKLVSIPSFGSLEFVAVAP